jgi:hypothetical protein
MFRKSLKAKSNPELARFAIAPTAIKNRTDPVLEFGVDVVAVEPGAAFGVADGSRRRRVRLPRLILEELDFQGKDATGEL